MRAMCIKTRGALLPILFCAVLSAQDRPQARSSNNISDRVDGRATDTDQRSVDQRPSTTRSLNLSEGLAILGAALESRHRGKSGSDCSHLVQGIYERAGFPYSYVNSSELYAGIDQFRPVAISQPGDLVVWSGHVGIVVNPMQHSFFSLLRSGRGVETYDSPYWKRRGTPRFFRYVKATPSDALPASTWNASLTPVSSEIRSLGQAVANPLRVDASLPVQPMLVHVLVRVSNSAKPSPDQLSSALLKTFRDSEPALRNGDLFHLTKSLTVFDQFEIKKVQTSGNQGWAEVQIHEVITFAPIGVKTSRLWERQRWSLRRHDKNSWELTLPENVTYLSQEIAVRVLAHQLANLADSRSNSANVTDQKAELARVLSSLLESQPRQGPVNSKLPSATTKEP
jgi:hypothetical protein